MKSSWKGGSLINRKFQETSGDSKTGSDKKAMQPVMCKMNSPVLFFIVVKVNKRPYLCGAFVVFAVTMGILPENLLKDKHWKALECVIIVLV